MVVGLVALLAANLGMDFLVTIKRVENQLHSQQANALMRGAEGIARSALRVDLDQGPDIDHISEGWLNQPQQFPTDFGLIAGTVCDLQGRFNLNNLAQKASAAGKYTEDQKLFIRLLQTLALETPIQQQQAEDITNAVVDWLDADNTISSTGGAESGYYADLDLPYRPANRTINDVSELRWVKGVDEHIYRALEPFVTAFDENTAVNINTAPVNIIRSINETTLLQPLSQADAEQIIADRDGDLSGEFSDISEGFKALSDFESSHPASDNTGANVTVKSNYFLLDTQAQFLDRDYQLRSVLYRNADGEITTIARSQARWHGCEIVTLNIPAV